MSVEAAVTPAEPHARVLFHLKGQDWPPGPGSLPCAWLHATHPAGTAHRACHFQVRGWAPPRLALLLYQPEGKEGSLFLGSWGITDHLTACLVCQPSGHPRKGLFGAQDTTAQESYFAGLGFFQA